MAVGPEALRPPAGLARAVRLGPGDLPAIKALLSARDYFAPFAPVMLEHGVYCGIRDEGRLLAVAGTHVVAPTAGVAAIGNVYTAPEHRRRGYALATTAAVAAALFADGYRRAVLNVHRENAGAVAVYRRLGFTVSGEFWECPTARRRET
jgi:ribosomal protein S18 acetylase RimI-like enzyme